MMSLVSLVKLVQLIRNVRQVRGKNKNKPGGASATKKILIKDF